MYGFDHIPLAQRAIQVDEFCGAYGILTSLDSEYHSYAIPKGATFLYVVLVGAGGNGGTPSVGAALTGFGGGGSGAITKALIPTFLLPNTLYIKIGSMVGTTGGVTFLSLYPQNNSPTSNEILRAAGGGSTISGTGGSAGGVFASGGKWAGTLALWVSQAGAAGGAGSTTNGAAVTALGTLPLTGGGGGGGSSAGTGGNVTGAGPFPTISGGASGLNPGNGGMMLRQPFGGVGGSGGGGSNAAGTGANFGGDGAIGCGGGGGGNAASGTPGAGGKGGPGYCLIVAF